MWSLYNNAKQWGQRPSTMIAVTQEYHAYCIDEAVSSWGNYVIQELEKIEGKNEKEVNRKRHSKLLLLMGAPDNVRFRSILKSKGK